MERQLKEGQTDTHRQEKLTLYVSFLIFGLFFKKFKSSTTQIVNKKCHIYYIYVIIIKKQNLKQLLGIKISLLNVFDYFTNKKRHPKHVNNACSGLKVLTAERRSSFLFYLPTSSSIMTAKIRSFNISILFFSKHYKPSEQALA